MEEQVNSLSLLTISIDLASWWDHHFGCRVEAEAQEANGLSELLNFFDLVAISLISTQAQDIKCPGKMGSKATKELRVAIF